MQAVKLVALLGLLTPRRGNPHATVGVPLEGAMARVCEVSMLEELLNPAPVGTSRR